MNTYIVYLIGPECSRKIEANGFNYDDDSNLSFYSETGLVAVFNKLHWVGVLKV